MIIIDNNHNLFSVYCINLVSIAIWLQGNFSKQENANRS